MKNRILIIILVFLSTIFLNCSPQFCLKKRTDRLIEKCHKHTDTVYLYSAAFNDFNVVWYHKDNFIYGYRIQPYITRQYEPIQARNSILDEDGLDKYFETLPFKEIPCFETVLDGEWIKVYIKNREPLFSSIDVECLFKTGYEPNSFPYALREDFIKLGVRSLPILEHMTVQDIEIFKETPAWDFAVALEKPNLKRAKKLLLDNEDLVNYQEPKFGMTLLMRAVLRENYKAVEFLLQNGADPNIVAKVGSTALFDAVSYSWIDVSANENPRFVKILLDYGADPNIPYCAPKVEGVTNPIECGTSPLMHAAGFEKVKLLVEAGAEIDYKTKLGTTAAIKALLVKRADVAHYLIVEKKAKVSEPYYFYDIFDKTKINFDKPHYPIELLEDWRFAPGSKEHELKMEIAEEFKRQGQDY